MLEFIAENYQDIILHTARIFSSVFDVMLAFLLINNFFRPKARVKKYDYIPFFLLAATLILLQEYTEIGYLRYIPECVFLAVFLFTMYSGRLRKKAAASAVFIAMLIFSTLISELIYRLVLTEISGGQAGVSTFSELLKVTLSNIIIIPLSVLVSVLLKDNAKGSSVFRMWIVLLIVPAVTLITFWVFQFILEVYEPVQQIRAYIYISCVGIILINAVVFVLFWFNQRQAVIKRENALLTSQLTLQEISVKNLENAYNRTRTFRHDIKNHILTMNILAENGDIEEIKKYLKEMSDILDESSYVRITGISAVDAILNEKLYEAQSDSITTNYDVMKLEKCCIKPVDMCIILSNALDNAIEANKAIEDPEKRYIKLKIYGDEAYTVISVTNPTVNDPVKMSAGNIRTTKKDSENHGLGLKSIESTTRKYDGEMLIKCEDNVFTIVLRLNALSDQGGI